MITLPRLRDQQAVESAVAEASATGVRYQARIGFLVGDEDLTPNLKEAEWEQVEIPITVDATLAGYVPQRLQTASTKLLVEINGALVPQLHGEKTAVRPGEDAFTTDMLSSSPGALLNSDDAITLDEYTEYPNIPPHLVCGDVVRRLPYDKTLIEIAEIPGVRVNFSGTGTEPGFLAEEKTGDVLSRLGALQNVGYDYRDTAYKGFVASIPTPIGRLDGADSSLHPSRAPKSYHARRLPDWNSNRPATPELLYRDVRVFCTDALGRLDWEIFEEVPYVGDIPIPQKGRTMHVPFNDYTPNGYQNGRRHAARLALDLARMVSFGEMLLPCFDPLYERGDRYRVAEDVKDLTGGHTEILWAMRTEAYKHGYNAQLGQGGGSEDSGILGTQITYSATILEQQKVRPPALIVPGRSPGITADYPRPLHGLAGENLYFAQGLEWVTAQPSELDPEELIIYANEDATIDPATGDLVVYE